MFYPITFVFHVMYHSGVWSCWHTGPVTDCPPQLMGNATTCAPTDAFHYVMFATVLYGARPTSIAVVIPAIYAFFKLLPMVALLVPRYQGRIANFIQGKVRPTHTRDARLPSCRGTALSPVHDGP